MLNDGISAVLLAYKEEENLRLLLPQIKKKLDELVGEAYEIIVIDSSEPLDNTKQVCRLFGAKYINQEEPFFGGAFRTAIKHACFDKFLIMDADFSHDPADIPALYNKFMTGYDVVIGSRYIEGGKNNDSTQSVIMSKMLNIVAGTMLGIKSKEISTDYRIYHTRQLKEIILKCNNYDILQEVFVMLRLKNPNFAIGEVPIVFNKRKYGKTKRKIFIQIICFAGSLVRLTLIRIIRPKKHTATDEV